MKKSEVDIKENVIKAIDPKILAYLLKDKTTKKNIIWATDDYAFLGVGYGFSDEITVPLITGDNGLVIRPRTEKTRDEQSARAKGKAEVFTPSWVCNRQNNLIDEAWFGRANVFSVETDDGWVTTKTRVEFSNTKGKSWQDYVKANRLEISCGEAPYLSSRYDAVTGVAIQVGNRVGLLDRKLRVVSENTKTEPEWVLWATKAVQSVYGYDWQGDNVLLARENILFSFAEHYEERFATPASKEYLIRIAKIVAWNIWQMDGIKLVVPNSCHPEEDMQLTLVNEYAIPCACPGCKTNDHSRHNGIYCRIYDWVANRSVPFYSFVLNGGRKYASKV